MRISVAIARACVIENLANGKDALTDNEESRKQLSCQFHSASKHQVQSFKAYTDSLAVPHISEGT